MYDVAIVGHGVLANVMVQLLSGAGLQNITLAAGGKPPPSSSHTLGANQTRILNALGYGDALLDQGHTPDREQVRLTRSAYMLAETPLGKFYADRYGAPLINIEHTLLEEITASSIIPEDLTLTDLESSHALVLNTVGETIEAENPLQWYISEISEGAHRANITWIGTGTVCWQFSTRNSTHFVFAVDQEARLSKEFWHPSLHEVLTAAKPVDPGYVQTREHWLEGNVVHLGEACLGNSRLLRETFWTGLEDAWVLSRMIENYEEAYLEGVGEYVKFRRPRVAKIAKFINDRTRAYTEPMPSKRLFSNLGIAFRSRFLPEMAMQRVDWLHKYDCIRGFH